MVYGRPMDADAVGPTCRQRFDAVGVAEAARMYVDGLRTSLARNDDGPEATDDVWPPGPFQAVCESLWAGEWSDHSEPELSTDERLEFLVLAADLSVDDDDVLWCLADGPASHLAGDDHTGAAELHLHAARATHPGVDRMFVVMQAYLRDVISTDEGWWADDWPLGRSIDPDATGPAGFCAHAVELAEGPLFWFTEDGQLASSFHLGGVLMSEVDGVALLGRHGLTILDHEVAYDD